MPPGRLADFIAEAQAVCAGMAPGIRVNPFGHLGDGNVHYNLSPPEGQAGFDGRESEIGQALAALATAMGGSFAAEHGLGRSKVVLADACRSAVERDLMALLKDAFDPSAIMNPGILVRVGKERKTFD